MPRDTARAMSQEVVREPIAVKGRPARGLEERLALRFPRITALLARAIWRLPVRSRFRRMVIRRVVVLGWEAMNREDFEFGLAFYDPDVESIYDPGMVTLGFGNARGREERRRMLTEAYAEAFKFRFHPDELIYIGNDRMLVSGRMKGSGPISSAPAETEWANLWTVSDGLVVCDQVITSRRQALKAAGLSG
jgi:ketosteroid isomerase-like protein